MIVVQTKIDLVSDGALDQQEKLLWNAVANEMAASLQHNVNEIPLTRCTFFKSAGGEPQVNELVLLMARLLSSRESLAVTYDG